MNATRYIESLKRRQEGNAAPDDESSFPQTDAASIYELRGEDFVDCLPHHPVAPDNAVGPNSRIEPDNPVGNGVFGLVELILKNRPGLERRIRDAALQPELIPRFLAIAVAAFTLFGIAAVMVLTSAGVWPELVAIAERLEKPSESLITFAATDVEGRFVTPWLDHSALKLIAAYTLGLIAATGVCLPSLYFYGLLSGLKMSMLDVTIHALKSKATSAIALIGILPIYVAVAMGMVIFDAPQPLLHASLWLGLILPFVAGLWGTRSLFVGFAGLADTMPPERRCRRECFLRRLVLSWAAVYTAVSPVMIFSLWEYFA